MKDAAATTPAHPTAVGFAPAKIILFGEHSVLYGQPALGIPVTSRGVTVRMSEGIGQTRIAIAPAWTPNGNGVVDAIHAFAERVRATQAIDRTRDIEVDFDVLPMAGLGSSSSASLAFVRALRAWEGTTTTRRNEVDEAIAVETAAGLSTSGVDATLSSFSRGFVWFQRVGGKRRARRIDVRTAARIVVAVMGPHAGTDTSTAHVRELGRAIPRVVRESMRLLGTIARAGKRSFIRGDAVNAGRAIDAAHGVLSALRVPSLEIEELVNVARKAGALGAKMTGAGGGHGGAMFGLASEEASAETIRHALENAGAVTWVETIH